MKLDLLHSRKTALAFTAVAVAATAVLGSHRSLAGERRAVEATLEQSADGSGYSVATDCRDMVNTARNLLTVTKKYLPDEETLLSSLEEGCRRLEEAESAAQRKEARDALMTASEGAQRALADVAQVSESDRGYLNGFRVDMAASAHSMEMDPYNQLARQFNEEILGKFPANVLGRITGIRALETFD